MKFLGVFLKTVCAIFVFSTLTACGGGGDVDPKGKDPVIPVSISLVSDAGDSIGVGGSYNYSKENSVISVTSTGGRLSVAVDGDEHWRAEFKLPDSYTELQPGSYSNMTRYPFHDTATGGLSWIGESRGCNTLTGWLVIDNVTYDAGNLQAIDLNFEQHCEGRTEALRGNIHWDVNDTTVPPGPVSPLPAALWQANPADVPATGNYVYLESEAGDSIGVGGTYLYTGAEMGISVTDARLTVGVNNGSGETWSGTFQAMNTLSRLEPGYYGDLQRQPFHNPAKGGLTWSGLGNGCNTLTGWFVVDDVTYVGDVLTAIVLRFEQHCSGFTPALHGQIRWSQ